VPHASDGLQETTTLTPPRSQPPRHRFFYVVATVLGVDMFPSASHTSHPHGESRPPQTSSELVASRFPYDYYQSLCG
jgi:hypothetical protein